MGLELEESPVRSYLLSVVVAPHEFSRIRRRRLKVFAAEQAGIPKLLQTTALRDQRKTFTGQDSKLGSCTCQCICQVCYKFKRNRSEPDCTLGPTNPNLRRRRAVLTI